MMVIAASAYSAVLIAKPGQIGSTGSTRPDLQIMGSDAAAVPGAVFLVGKGKAAKYEASMICPALPRFGLIARPSKAGIGQPARWTYRRRRSGG